MLCFIGDYVINEAALNKDCRVKDINGDSLIYEPLYTVDGYKSACDS
jgi:hypothetical protein